MVIETTGTSKTSRISYPFNLQAGEEDSMDLESSHDPKAEILAEISKFNPKKKVLLICDRGIGGLGLRKCS